MRNPGWRVNKTASWAQARWLFGKRIGGGQADAGRGVNVNWWFGFSRARRPTFCFFRQNAVQHRLATVAEPIKTHAHAWRNIGPRWIVFARPHHSAFTADEWRGVFKLKLKFHGRADGERIFGANEDAAFADVHGIAFDELFNGLALELNLERDGRAFFRSGVAIRHGRLHLQDASPSKALPCNE